MTHSSMDRTHVSTGCKYAGWPGPGGLHACRSPIIVTEGLRRVKVGVWEDKWTQIEQVIDPEPSPKASKKPGQVWWKSSDQMGKTNWLLASSLVYQSLCHNTWKGVSQTTCQPQVGRGGGAGAESISSGMFCYLWLSTPWTHATFTVSNRNKNKQQK